jgi:hypothetical protein
MRGPVTATLLLGMAAALIAAADPPAAEYPAIRFVHPQLIERYCATWSPAKPDPAAMAEVTRRLPEFQAAWDREGPALMRETVRLTGQPYRFKEALAALHACPDLSSMSSPMMIAAARYTEAAGGGAESGLVVRAAKAGKLPFAKLPPRPLADFTATVFHEVQHRYAYDLVSGFPNGMTPIMAKYANEHVVTRNHLHLFAIEKLVRQKLGSSAVYEAGRQRMRENGYTNYVRAHEIVEAEGAERIVAEIRAK